MMRAACRRAQRGLDHDQPDGRGDATARHHLQTCGDCQAAASKRAQVREVVRAANDVLDDMTRVRVLGRVLNTLERSPLATASRRSGTDGGSVGSAAQGRGRFRWSLALAAVAVVALGVGLRLRADRPSQVDTTTLALEPYAVHLGRDPAVASSGSGLDRLELPPHGWMRARLGRWADLTLLGPLELVVRDNHKQRVELELARGSLVGDFDGSGGQGLRILTTDATVDIVGTRFLVEATSTNTRVSVEHGRVRVESRGRVQMVDGGTSWSTDGNALEPLPDDVIRIFARSAHGGLPETATGEPEPSTTDTKAASTTPTPVHPSSAKLGATRAGARAAAPRGTPPGKPAHPHPAPASETHAAREAHPPDDHEAQVRVALVSRSTKNAARGKDAPSLAAPAEEESMVDRAAPEDELPDFKRGSATSSPATGPAPSVKASPVPSDAPVVPTRARAASGLYRRAEAALGRGEEGRGKELLEELINDFPNEATADSARFELAILATKAGRSSEALAQTREILRHGAGGPFVEPARFLRCRVYLEEDRDAATICLGRFVHDYPQSPHDAFALRALTELAEKSGDCTKATMHADLYLQRHPNGEFAAEARRVRSHCGP